MKQQTILITGACGFLGKAILQAMQAQANLKVIAACRDKTRLPSSFKGEVRQGDLRDAAYREQLVKDIDVICHAGTWASMWGHRQQENENFYQPTLALIQAAIDAKVQRFIMAGTVAIAAKETQRSLIDDFSAMRKTKFWPHLDYLIDVDRFMQRNAQRGTKMISLRLGHFVGAGNKIGLVPVLVPRLKTALVPWLAGGRSRLPLIGDSDLGNSFVRASLAEGLGAYESFNICGAEFPSTKEVITYIAAKVGVSVPWFSVSYPMGNLFARLMELIYPLVPGKAPFLTRSVVHLAEQWLCDTRYAQTKLGYTAEKDWRLAIDEALDDLKSKDYPWPAMSQPLT